jgi:hypothetical protein
MERVSIPAMASFQREWRRCTDHRKTSQRKYEAVENAYRGASRTIEVTANNIAVPSGREFGPPEAKAGQKKGRPPVLPDSAW